MEKDGFKEIKNAISNGELPALTGVKLTKNQFYELILAMNVQKVGWRKMKNYINLVLVPRLEKHLGDKE